MSTLRFSLSEPTEKPAHSAAWFKKGSGTVVRSTLRAVPATVPDPFLNQAAIRSRLAQLEIEGLAGEIDG